MGERAAWQDLTLPADGRQSARALDVQRGVCRLLTGLQFAPLTEFTLANGRRADVAAVGGDGTVVIVEIKTSLADLRADAKWPDYFDFCDRLYFAVPHDFPLEELPEDAGLIVADRFGAEVLRESPEDRLAAARRKAVMLRFARAGAQRLQYLADPDTDGTA